jgi:hypothetical protein
MPLIEYRKKLAPVYNRVLKGIRSEENEYAEQLRPQPYPLLLNQFNYAWSPAKII